MIRDYLENNVLVTDGAMGTYYTYKTGKAATFSELANKYEPQIIKDIHTGYIESGAKLIRTNTFAANRFALNLQREEVREILSRGYKIAKDVTRGKDVFIAADIGPVPEAEATSKNVLDDERIIEEYQFIVDTFIEENADIFLFETFSTANFFREITSYIKNKNPDSFIITQFALTLNGYTRKGISATKILEQVKNLATVDACGFNCGVGPTHLYNIMKNLDLEGKPVVALPNAGYPEIVNERTVYALDPDYFAEVMLDIKKLGVKILGGCCGTEPRHIKKLVYKLNDYKNENIEFKHKVKKRDKLPNIDLIERNSFYEKIMDDRFVVAVELDPPSDPQINKIVKGAELLNKNGVDIITIADSPLGRVRLDSMMMATKIRRETGAETLPHICCRDSNIIGLKAKLLAGYVEGIRNVLVVTGDPVPISTRDEIKSVFNLNSFKLIDLISEMNQEEFVNSPFYIGGALNLNSKNRDAELKRMNKKMEAGANFFLTQPVYEEVVIEYLNKIKRRKEIKILAGIMPLVSYKNARFIANEIPGINIPDRYINRFKPEMNREEAENCGIELAVELGQKIKQYVDGFYFITPFARVEVIAKILQQLGLS